MVAWSEKGEAADEIVKWREAWLAGMLIVRYADVLIIHETDGWALLPNTVLRQNIYTDPRKPVAVEPGLESVRHSRRELASVLHDKLRVDILHCRVGH